MQKEIADELSPLKDALLRKRGEILAAGSAAKPIQQAGMEKTPGRAISRTRPRVTTKFIYS